MNPVALYNITYGLYCLTTRHEGKDNGCIINTVMQVAEHPVRVAISVNKGNLTHDMILADGRFNVSALTVEAPFSLFQHFGMQSGRSTDKFADFADAVRTENGLMRLNRYAGAWLSCDVRETVDLGTHTMFIAEVIDCDVLENKPCCTYGYYQANIKPKPAKARKKGWVCNVCGFIYEGDELPEDYVCPLCKHGREDFSPLEDTKPEKPVKKWRCTICGEVVEGTEPPQLCPLCKQPADKFEEVSA